MSLIIRDVPELKAVLRKLADQGISLGAPAEGNPNGPPTMQHWVECTRCNNVVAAPTNVISLLCEDCTAECPDPDCGLLEFQHDLHGGCAP